MPMVTGHRRNATGLGHERPWRRENQDTEKNQEKNQDTHDSGG